MEQQWLGDHRDPVMMSLLLNGSMITTRSSCGTVRIVVDIRRGRRKEKLAALTKQIDMFSFVDWALGSLVMGGYLHGR